MNQLILLKNQRVLAEKCRVARTFWTRLRGLIGRSGLEPGEALWIERCNSIHMAFMRFRIDVIFLAEVRTGEGKSKKYQVLSICTGIKPWKFIPVSDFKADHVIEFASPEVSRFQKEWNLNVGDEVCLS